MTRSGTIPARKGEFKRVPSSPLRIPLEGTTLTSSSTKKIRVKIPALRRPLFSCPVAFLSCSCSPPLYCPSLGVITLSLMKVPTKVRMIVEAIIKYQLEAALTVAVGSIIWAASSVTPHSSASVPVIRTLAVNPALVAA